MKSKKKTYYAYGGEEDNLTNPKRHRLDCPTGDCEKSTLRFPVPNFLLPNPEKRAARVARRNYNPDDALLEEINYPGVGTNRYYPVTSFDPQPDREVARFPSNRLTGVNYDPNNMMATGGEINYTRQPLVNASTMRNMVDPYAMGGSIDDLDEEEMAELNTQAEESGVTPEEMFEMLNSQDEYQGEDNIEDIDYEDVPNDTQDEEGQQIDDVTQEYGKGGWIQKAVNPKHKGYCTPMTKSTCTPRRKALARTFKKHHGFHALGGRIGVNANVEGKEVLETPGGKVLKIKGPSHENGGVDIKAPNRTKVYSKRISIDGKGMNDRKIAREARLKKLEKLMAEDPTNVLLKNTIKRTSQTIHDEDAQDMAIQKAASQIYSPPQEREEEGYAYGGKIRRYGYGDLIGSDTLTPRGKYENYGFTPPPIIPEKPTMPGELTTGDYIGLIGTGFNAIAPLINTRQAFRATPPAINRYRGMGHDALDINQSISDNTAIMRTNAETNVATSRNSRYARNANSASSVNTLRALDAVVDMQSDKASNDINDSSNKQEMVIGQDREKLLNTRDQYEAYGQTGADDRNTANIDNYFTNRGQNLVNFGREVQVAGRNVNIAKKNKVDANLLSQLSIYGLQIDEDGNIVNK